MNQSGRKSLEENMNVQELVGETKMSKRPPAPLNLKCGVCSAPAPDHLHFGAHCCYSCRAFFRRTTERKEAKGLKRCRTGLQNCEVSDTTKSCIHCRYTKCIEIGMTPDLMKGRRKRDLEEQGVNDGNEAEDDDHLKQEDNMHKQELIKKKKENESYKSCRLEDGDKKKSKLSGITPEF